MEVGIGSSSHCLFGDLVISLEISIVSVGRKLSRCGGVRVGFGKWGDWVDKGMLVRRLVTLLEKNVANCCAMDVTGETFGREGTEDLCNKELTVFQSLRGSERLEEMRLE